MAEFKLDRFKYNWRGEWTAATEYKRDDIVRLNGKSYVCVVTHTANAIFRDDLNAILPGSNPPQPQPKWVVMTDGRQFIGEYATDVVYDLGDIVVYDGVTWVCINSHTSTGAPSESVNWELLVNSMAFVGAWTSGVVYGPGAIVKYGGNAYKCITAHQAGGTLEESISNWEDFYIGYQYRGDWAPGTDYFVNDLVKYGATIFNCTESHTSSGPELDLTKFVLEIPGSQKEPIDWDSETYYQNGDIVRYGGFLYIANDNSFDVDPSRDQDDSTVTWVMLAKTTSFLGEWGKGRIYKPGNVVLRGGNLYMAVRDVNLATGTDSTADYLDPDIWEHLAPGQIWDGSWTVGKYYSVGDVVYHLGSAYVCNTEHLSTSIDRPNNLENYFYWDVLIEAGSPGGLHDKGDLLTYGLSREWALDDSTEGDVRVPIGSNLQALSVSDEHEAFWRNTTADADVIYVSTTGKDLPGYGKTHQTPFRTIRHACEYVEDNYTPLTPTKIQVATGRFEEIGPIPIPAGCVVMGDELRSTTVVANSPIPEYLSELPYIKTISDKLNLLILDLIQNRRIDVSEGNLETQVFTKDVSSIAAAEYVISRFNDYINYITFVLESTDTLPTTTGSNTLATENLFQEGYRQLFANREFLAHEILYWLKAENPLYNFDNDRILGITRTLIRGLALDLRYQNSNFRSILAARRYTNGANGSQSDDIFYMRDTTGLRNMTTEGLQGTLNPPGVFELYQRPTGGSCVSLDPGWGPDDDRVWIVNRSPYIQGVTNIGTGCVGCKIDGDLHNGGVKSMVTNDFTQVLSDGIGCWVTNGARAELVSMFTYYCAVGYLASNGGTIRAANGNNSYGLYGSVSDGNDPDETPQSVTVNNRVNEAVVKQGFAGGNTDQLFIFEYENTGTEYTNASASIIGAGAFANVEFTDFRDGAIMEGRLVNTQGSGSEGGSNYMLRQGYAQVTADSTSSIILSATDVTQDISEIDGMSIKIISGDGVGQYGVISAFDPVTKTVTVNKESDGAPGWDHVVAGWPIETALDSTAYYRISARVQIDPPAFSSQSADIPLLKTWAGAAYGYTTQLYNNLAGQAGTGETFETNPVTSTWRVNREGDTYTVTNLNPGAGYAVGDTITIAGTSLGGTSPDNDLVITVTGTSEDSTNSIQTFTSEGTPVGKLFILSDITDTVLYSKDTVNWNTATIDTSNGQYIKAIAEDNRFLIIQNTGNNYQFSYTGDDWNTRSLPVTESWSDIAYGNGIFVITATGTDTVLYSSDGLTFTQATMPSSQDWIRVAYGQGKFIAIADTGACAYSTDGQTWTAGGTFSSGTYKSLVYGNNRFLAVTESGTTLYSLDQAQNWTAGGTVSGGFDVKEVQYKQGIFFAIGNSGTNNQNASTSEDGIIWDTRSLSSAARWSTLTFAKLDGRPKWISFADQVSVSGMSRSIAGARAKAISDISQGSFDNMLIWDPGSAYELDNPPTVTVTDNQYVTEVEIDLRMRDGTLAQPDFVNRGSGYRTSSSVITITGDGFADIIPEANDVVVSGVTTIPGPGVQIRFTSIPDETTIDPDDYKLFTGVGITDLGDDGSGNGTRTIKIKLSPRLKNEYNLEHATAATLRSNYSQCRISGHDFLDIGTGNFEETNYPEIYAGGNFFTAAPENEVLEQNGGRVFYTSTDQDGNFRAGELFAVNQATGVVTISAEFFDLDGLSELALGGVRLGGSGTVVREFSTDPTFSEDSNNIVPTQRAIASFLAERLSVGGENLELNGVIAGTVRIGTTDNVIENVAGGANAVNFPGTIIIDGNYDITDQVGTVIETRETGLQGSLIAMQFFLNDPFEPGMQ